MVTCRVSLADSGPLSLSLAMSLAWTGLSRVPGAACVGSIGLLLPFALAGICVGDSFMRFLNALAVSLPPGEQSFKFFSLPLAIASEYVLHR